MSDENIQESPSTSSSEPAASHEHSSCEVAAPPFSKSEIIAMHEEDRKAAGNIVLLMASIFAAGVVGYMIVDYIVSQGF